MANPSRTNAACVRRLWAVAGALPATTRLPNTYTWPKAAGKPSSASKTPASLALARGDTRAHPRYRGLSALEIGPEGLGGDTHGLFTDEQEHRQHKSVDPLRRHLKLVVDARPISRFWRKGEAMTAAQGLEIWYHSHPTIGLEFPQHFGNHPEALDLQEKAAAF